MIRITNKIKSYEIIIEDLFSLKDKINIHSTFLKELRDLKKSKCEYLSCINTKLNLNKATKGDIKS